MNKPPIIEHDPDERPGRRYSLGKWWLAIWAMVAIFWLLQFREGLDFEQICLGFLSGGILAIWAVDMHLSSGGSNRDL